MSDSERFDFVVLGSGPGGQKAAVCAAKAGRRVALVEREAASGGACVHRGTIPSKTLRENAIRVQRLRDSARELGVAVDPDLTMEALMGRLGDVVESNARTVAGQLDRNGIERIHGRGRFLAPDRIEVVAPGGGRRVLETRFVVIATGSRPRAPEGMPVDHEHVLDSDTILRLPYLPQSLTVLGAGVIASEYASMFARLGVEVTMIDRGERPVGFLDPELSEVFRAAFEAGGSRYLPQRRIESVGFDGVSRVVTCLEDGEEVASEKLLVALGRVGCLEDLDLASAGLAPTERGLLAVDEGGRTAVETIYAVGDVVGPPALATTAMEQGRRAACHALGLEPGRLAGLLPIGIYTLPELASVGLSAAEVEAQHGGVCVGRARFSEVARGLISGAGEGLLKLVADPAGERLLGVHIAGEGATELVHVGQMALLAGTRVEELVENVFNFPTLAEAYRIAALDLRNRRDATKPDPADD